MNPGKIEVAANSGVYVIKLSGDVRLNMCSALEQYLDQMFVDAAFKTVLIDLSEAEGVDSTTLGQLAKISIISQQKFNLIPSIITPRVDITRILLSMGFDKVFYLLSDQSEELGELNELVCSQTNESEDEVREKVIEAHEILMSLNEDNKNTFQELVDCLQDKNNNPRG
ncbi:anti-anti-sigma factor [Oleispira antarctica]|uniref:Anti-anti-sigma factor n=1 Tax=Oleispira antarctica TaxID=188908 RepID=A0A1Y5HIZ5_OLEAN|nr:anti-anti-sigma factor [Oleispira antarctica]